jgi:uncharacterized protein
MKNLFASALLSCAVLTGLLPFSSQAAPKKIVVVTITTGFRHSSISTAEEVLKKLATDSGEFTLSFVQQPPNEPRSPQPPKLPKNPSPEDQAKFDKATADFPKVKADYEKAHAAWMDQVKTALQALAPSKLADVDAVLFANTTGDLPLPDKDGFMKWLESGKSFIGMHSASDTFHEYRPFIQALGGEFLTHGAQVKVDCINQDPKHPACQHLGPVWSIFDEIYQFKSFERPRVHGLLTLDKHPNENKPGDYPVAWCRKVENGRVFYTSLGHREDVWNNPVYQKHILGGIRWALGLAPHEIQHAP